MKKIAISQSNYIPWKGYCISFPKKKTTRNTLIMDLESSYNSTLEDSLINKLYNWHKKNLSKTKKIATFKCFKEIEITYPHLVLYLSTYLP